MVPRLLAAVVVLVVVSSPSRVEAGSSAPGVLVTASSLNVRASAWGTVLGSAPENSGWVLTGSRDQGFVEVSFRGRKAWLSESYTKSFQGTGARITAGSTSVRDGASDSAKLVGSAFSGQTYVEAGASGSWVQIRYDENLRWIARSASTGVALSGSLPAATTTGSGGLPAWLQPIMSAAVAQEGLPASWATSSALAQLVAHESSFDPDAQNPSSTAYGLFQFLDSTWASVGGHKTSDAKLQCVYGLRYVKQRYGTPEKAWTFWQQHHWY